jgi:hypothetical protein
MGWEECGVLICRALACTEGEEALAGRPLERRVPHRPDQPANSVSAIVIPTFAGLCLLAYPASALASNSVFGSVDGSAAPNCAAGLGVRLNLHGEPPFFDFGFLPRYLRLSPLPLTP